MIFTAHGVSPQVKAQAAEMGLRSIDATCSDVVRTHDLVKDLAGRGFHILYIGQRKHPEPEGVLGEAPGQVARRGGIIGQIGTLLGTKGVNIARMSVGRRPGSGRAIMLIEVDSEVPAPVVTAVAAIPGVRAVAHASDTPLGDGESASPTVTVTTSEGAATIGRTASINVVSREFFDTLNIPLKSGTVSAEGDLDFRGTLGVAKDAPVGFAQIRLTFDVGTDAPQDKLDLLLKLTERYCVVYQTIKNGPKVSVSMKRV